MAPSPDEFAKMDAEALRQHYAETVLRREGTHHVGRSNRLFGEIGRIGDRLVALGEGSERELLPLLNHPSATVRRSAAFDVRPFDRALFLSVMEGLVSEGGAIGREARFDLESVKRREEREAQPAEPRPAPDPNWLRIVNWQKDNPPPPAMSRDEFADRVATQFSPDRAEQILELARPAIGLWPQGSASDKPLASRHCGEAWAPPAWQWPIYEEEPMYFLGQIHCPDLAGLPGSELLPDDGLLTFFGDYDAISGCDGAGSVEQGAVNLWPAEGLVPTEPPLPLDHAEEQQATPVLFRPFTDLPDPFSEVVDALDLTEEEAEAYRTLRDEAVRAGIPADVVDYCDLGSKLLGWPHLVQDDFDLPQSGRDAVRLLAQLPARLGPGGSLYFFITDEDLAERRFDCCILEEQNT